MWVCLFTSLVWFLHGFCFQMTIIEWKYMCALFVVAGLGGTAGVLDLDELKSLYYDIDILDKPLLRQDEITSNDAVILSSKYGQLYQCSHPPVLSLHDQKQADYRANNSSVVELLNPLKTRPCLSYTKGWWTYEFCYGRDIKQYHAEDGKAVGDIIFLGHFESDFDGSNDSVKLFQKQKSAEHYHSQTYVNGSYCELIDRSRTAEARFVCQEGHGDYVAGVDERETCSYVVTVHTNRICSHPQFGPPVSIKTVTISCNPLLTASEYEIYVQDVGLSDKTADETALLDIDKEQHLSSASQSSEDLQKLFMESFLTSVHAALTGQQKDRDAATDASDVSVESAQVDTMSDSSQSSADMQDVASFDALSDDIQLNAEHDVSRDASSESSNAGDIDNDDDVVGDDNDDINVEVVDDEDSEFVREFDQELNEIASSARMKAQLTKYKETIQSAMESQFSDIVDEAKADMMRQGDDTAAVDTQDAFQKLAKTLNVLIERLERLENGELNAKTMAKNTKDTEDIQGTKNDDGVELDDTSVDGGDTAGEHDTDKQLDGENDERVKVKVKFLKKLISVSSDEEDGSRDLTDANHDSSSDSELKQPAENRLRDRLEQAGLKTAGRKVEFRILTTGYYDSKDSSLHSLSDEDSSAFSKVIIAIIGGDDAEVKEQERHQRLEENYRFNWDKSKNKQPQTINV